MTTPTDTGRAAEAEHVYTLFVAGGTELAARAVANFDRLVRSRLDGQPSCRLTVIDILKEPAAARENRILATPVLVRERPAPVVKILGDLSQDEAVLRLLGLAPPAEPSARENEDRR